MKTSKYFLIITILAIGIAGTGLYTSCTKSTCKGVTCLNGGNCSGGGCVCKDGIGGLSCELVYRETYANVYKGSGNDDSGRAFIDNTFTFTAGTDSNYNRMQVAWNNHSLHIVNMTIELTTKTATESAFTVTQVGVIGVDSFVYTGGGIVSKTSASMTLTETRLDSTVRTITLNNFIRQ